MSKGRGWMNELLVFGWLDTTVFQIRADSRWPTAKSSRKTFFLIRVHRCSSVVKKN